MRKLINIILLILAVLLFAVGFRFAAENADPLSISWLGWSSPEGPTFLWLVASMVFGITLGYLGFLGKNLSLRLKLRQSQAELKRRTVSQNRIVTAPEAAAEKE
ncbi:MAG: LapA family protein [Porticoccaceae bacterium]|nr:LapA family protein [Porticoccaceae bacterium]